MRVVEFDGRRKMNVNLMKTEGKNGTCSRMTLKAMLINQDAATFNQRQGNRMSYIKYY